MCSPTPRCANLFSSRIPAFSPFLERVAGRPLELPTSFNMADTKEHEPTVEVSADARIESHCVAVSGARAAIFCSLGFLRQSTGGLDEVHRADPASPFRAFRRTLRTTSSPTRRSPTMRMARVSQRSPFTTRTHASTNHPRAHQKTPGSRVLSHGGFPHPARVPAAAD